MFVPIQSILVAVAAPALARAAYTPTACSENGSMPGEVCSRSLLDTILTDVTELLFARELGMSSFSGNKTLSERELSQRVVYSPKITSPGATTVWVAGTTATVTWDASNPPKGISHSSGMVVLGHLDDGSENEHLDVDHPLATGFDITKGSVNVKVPYVSPRNDYIIVLFGDSGNRSPSFTIN